MWNTIQNPPIIVNCNNSQVMTWQAYNTTEFKPQITNEDAEHRYSHWNKAVARSYDLASQSVASHPC
jgi:glycerol kinase